MVSAYNFLKYIALCELNYLAKLKGHSKYYTDHLVCTLPHGIYPVPADSPFSLLHPILYNYSCLKYRDYQVPSLPDTTTRFNLLEIFLQS